MCGKIFLARIFDVSISTIRQTVLRKDYMWIGTILAFWEIFVWFLVAREALVVAIDSIFIPISYSLGYATGTLLGSYFSIKWMGGIVGVQIITKDDNKELIGALKLRGYSLSVIKMEGDKDNQYQMIFIELKSKSYLKLKELVHRIDSHAFVIVSDTKKVWNGIIK